MTDQAEPRAPAVTVRKASSEDAATLLDLIAQLARFEKLHAPDSSARERLVRDIFGPAPRLDAYLALDGRRAVGYALVFETYSSFLALPTLYLEDIFVVPAYRNRRVGYTLFSSMVQEARRRGCGRMEWVVLDWNRRAIEFYEGLGARHMKEWHLFRLALAEAGGTPDGEE